MKKVVIKNQFWFQKEFLKESKIYPYTKQVATSIHSARIIILKKQ